MKECEPYPVWFIEKTVSFENDDPRRLAEAVDSCGGKYHREFPITYYGVLENPTFHLSPYTKLENSHQSICTMLDGVVGIFHGTINTARLIQRTTDMNPGAIVDFNALACSSYYNWIYSELFNTDFLFVPYQVFKNEPLRFFDHFGTNRLFVRPDSSAKIFTGGTVTLDENNEDNLQSFITSVEYQKTNLQPLLVLSSCKEIESEFRFVVVDGKVISGSQYRKNGELDSVECGQSNADQEMEKCAQKTANMLLTHFPDDVYCIDIARNKSTGAIGVLELNGFSTSGLYACDLREIAETVSKHYIEKYKRDQ